MESLLPYIERPLLFIVAAIISFPIYIAFGQLFFRSWNEFLDACTYVYQPTWLSVLRGEWHEDNWLSLKLFLYLIFCVAGATAVYKLSKLFF